ncbi:MAG: hypothetical protein LBE03_01265 [Candidatus Nomurabacteria bacterium]|nr:hypothetical protein [Candidatus Nomurabacteria bacterium]
MRSISKKNRFSFTAVIILTVVVAGAITAMVIFNNNSGIIVGRALDRFITNKTPALNIEYHKNDGSLDINTNFSSKIDEKNQKSGINGTLQLKDSYTGISGDLKIGGMQYDNHLYYRIEGVKDLTTSSATVSHALSNLDIEAGGLWTQFDTTSLGDFLTKIDGSVNAECSTVLVNLLEYKLSDGTKNKDLAKVLRNDLPFVIQAEFGKTEDGLLKYKIGASSKEIIAYFAKIASFYKIDQAMLDACYIAPEEASSVELDIYIHNGIFSKVLKKIVVQNDLWTLTISEIKPTDFDFDDFNTMTTLSRNNTVFTRLIPKVKAALVDEITTRSEYQERVIAESDETYDSACNNKEVVAEKIKNEVKKTVDERLQVGVLLRYE